MAPNDWAGTAISLLEARGDDRIIAEVSNGGDMVENTLRMVDPSVPFRSVCASRGKVTRAEPISTFYEQGRVHHVGSLARLEDQMGRIAPCEWRRAVVVVAGVDVRDLRVVLNREDSSRNVCLLFRDAEHLPAIAWLLLHVFLAASFSSM